MSKDTVWALGVDSGKKYMQVNKCFHRLISSKTKTWESGACCWMGQGSWQQRTQKSYSMLYLSQSLLVRLAFKNSRHYSPKRKSGARNTCPQWTIRLRNTKNLDVHRPWDLIGCSHGCWRSWLLSLWGHCQSYLKALGNWKKINCHLCLQEWQE